MNAMDAKNKASKITFNIPEKEWVSLKMICMLTHTTMTNFIRSSIKDKINDINIKHEGLK